VMNCKGCGRKQLCFSLKVLPLCLQKGDGEEREILVRIVGLRTENRTRDPPHMKQGDNHSAVTFSRSPFGLTTFSDDFILI
jgi:hypothetical protein